jgi:hypothetical protein
MTGLIILLNNAPIMFLSKLQETASGAGTGESEYKALYVASINVSHLRDILYELGYKQNEPTIIHEDNSSCIDLALNPGINKRKFKGINIKIHPKEWRYYGVLGNF